MLTFYEREDGREGWTAATVAAVRSATDPLQAQCEHFVAAVRSPGEPWSGGREAAAVVTVVESLERSLARAGRPEPVGAAPVGAPAEGASVIPLPIRSA
jgi:hypothetical protein